MYYNSEKLVSKNVRNLISNSVESFLWSILKEYYKKSFLCKSHVHTFSIRPHSHIRNCLSILHYVDIDKISNIYSLRTNEKITLHVYVEYKNGYFIMFLKKS